LQHKKSHRKSKREKSDDLTIKIKPKIIISDMLQHPELFNKTAVLNDKKRKNLLKSAQSTKADVKS
jgi:hypothetical protein